MPFSVLANHDIIISVTETAKLVIVLSDDQRFS